jgi:hypothetical protein
MARWQLMTQKYSLLQSVITTTNKNKNILGFVVLSNQHWTLIEVCNRLKHMKI